MNSAPASSASALGLETRYEQLHRLAGDLYPDRYTPATVRRMVPIASEIRALANAKGAIIVAHNYVYPELQEVADAVGDSLGLSQCIARQKPRRVAFCGARFMGGTAKVITGRSSEVYMPDVPGVPPDCRLAHRMKCLAGHLPAEPVHRAFFCRDDELANMKMNTLEKLLYSLHRDRFEVTLDPGVADAARVPIERMLAIH